MKIFAPSPDLAYKCQLYAWWNNGFTSEELDAICDMGERAPIQNGLIGNDQNEIQNDKIRNSAVSWLEREGWLADRIEYIARQLNGQFFGLDLWGFGEKFQYTTYKYSPKHAKQHYDWHMDQGFSYNVPRKLSLVLMLSDPDEYKGGDLEIMVSGQIQTLSRERGVLHAFPSYVMHRVTPVTSGIRRTLVVWISGPKFR